MIELLLWWQLTAAFHFSAKVITHYFLKFCFDSYYKIAALKMRSGFGFKVEKST